MYIHNLDPVLLDFGFIAIRWYSLAYIFGIVLGWWLGKKIIKNFLLSVNFKFDLKEFDDLITYLIISIIIGGRLGYILFYNFEFYISNPIEIIKVWEGGMSFHGGLLGVLAAMALFARHRQIEWGRLMDFVAPLTPMGLALGRLGNFIGQELWGRPADVPWAMVFPNDPLGLARHPSQLYQFALEGCLLFLVLLWFSRRQRPTWAVSGVFLVGYGALRFVAEFFREPDAHIGFDALGWMTRGQLLCVPMLIAGLCLLYWAYRPKTR